MQITITIQKNGVCLISPSLPERLNKTLAKELSYEKKDAFWIRRNGIWDGIVRLYSLKKQTFNYGLLNKVTDAIYQYWNTYGSVESLEVIDKRTKFKDIVMPKKLNIELREYQNEAVHMFLGNQVGVIEVATGGGKTEIALECIRRVHKRTLILVHTHELFNQWCKRIQDRLGISVGGIAGALFRPKDVTVGMMQTLSGKIDKKNVKYIDYLKTVNFLINDECHHNPCDTIYKIAKHTSNAIWRLGLSATAYREDGEDMKIDAIS